VLSNLEKNMLMPDLLVEFLSEEIPARMQRQAAENFKKMLTNKLVDAGLTYEMAYSYPTPRRLTCALKGVSAHSSERHEERKGPSVNAPQAAIATFQNTIMQQFLHLKQPV